MAMAQYPEVCVSCKTVLGTSVSGLIMEGAFVLCGKMMRSGLCVCSVEGGRVT